MTISPVSDYNWNRYTHICSLTCGVTAIMVRRARWKPLEHPILGKKIVIQTQCHILRGISEMSATVKDLKHVGRVIPTIPQFTLQNYPVQTRCILEDDSASL